MKTKSNQTPRFLPTRTAPSATTASSIDLYANRENRFLGALDFKWNRCQSPEMDQRNELNFKVSTDAQSRDTLSIDNNTNQATKTDALA